MLLVLSWKKAGTQRVDEIFFGPDPENSQNLSEIGPDLMSSALWWHARMWRSLGVLRNMPPPVKRRQEWGA